MIPEGQKPAFVSLMKKKLASSSIPSTQWSTYTVQEDYSFQSIPPTHACSHIVVDYPYQIAIPSFTRESNKASEGF